MLRVIDRLDAGVLEDVDEVCRRLRKCDGSARSMELSRPDGAWPMLSILANGEWCVLHLTTTEDGPLLTLSGEPPDGAPEELEFTYAGIPTVFTRRYLNSLVTAVEMVRAFATNAPFPDDARWEEL